MTQWIKKMLPLTVACILTPAAIYAQSKPTPVQEVDVPEKRAFQLLYSMGDLSATPNTMLTVPVTKRWVIEHISVECRTSPGFLVFGTRLYTTVTGSMAHHNLPLTPQGNAEGLQWFAGSYPVKIYADGGTPIQFAAKTNNSNGGHCLATISGYSLEILPLHF